jgi:hypothetical protein
MRRPLSVRDCLRPTRKRGAHAGSDWNRALGAGGSRRDAVHHARGATEGELVAPLPKESDESNEQESKALTTKGIAGPIVIAVGMLLWALNPENPYGYYILLRFVLCGIMAYLAFRAMERDSLSWTWALGIGAVIYNPIIRVHLNREIWSVVNVATIIVLIAFLLQSRITSSRR